MQKRIENVYVPIRLLSIETEGFSYFPRQEILIHEGITLLDGPNGAGKTTFLNMIRLLFGAKKFDNSATFKTFFERDDIFDIYILGRFDNRIDPLRGRRPFEAIGKFQEVVTVVCRLINEYPNPKRDYLIFDGMFEFEEHLKNNLRWLEVNQYIRQLEEVGVSRALVNAFSLNQGNTEKLFDLSQEELADYVLQICGEHDRIEEFQKIKVDVKRQKEEYNRLLLQKQQEETNARKIADRIQRCKAIMEQKELIKFAQTNKLFATYKESEEKLECLQREWEILAEDIQRLDVELFELSKELEQLNKEKIHTQNILNDLHFTNSQIQQRIFELANQVIELEKELEEVSKFIQHYEQVPLMRLDMLEEEAARVKKEHEQDYFDLHQLEREKQNLEQQILLIERTKATPYPTEVQQMLRSLEDKGIDFLLMAEQIEIIDPAWREAIEALLGEERFTVLVPETQVVSVMKWAQEKKYPYWISPFRPVALKKHSSSVLAKLQICDERITGYLQKFETFMLAETMEQAWNWVKQGKQALLNDPHPYKVVSRGGRSITTKGIYCGKKAYEAQLVRLKLELGHLQGLYNEKQNSVQSLLEQLNQIQENIDVQINVRLIPEKKEIYNTLEHKTNYTRELLEQQQKKLEENSALEQEWLNKDRDVHVNFSLKNKTQGEDIKKRTDLYEHKRITEEALHAQKEQVSRHFQLLPDEIKSVVHDSVRMIELCSVHEYENQIKVATKLIETHRKDLQGLDFIPEGEEERIAALEQNHQTHLRLLAQHIAEIKKVEQDLQDLELRRSTAQEEYHAMVEEVLYKVKRSLEELAKSKNIHATLDINCHDERWTVDYRIGFNGKPTKSYRNKSVFSGGEKVIASLLLTFAAIKADGMLSFMILDEPFAHLDQERIKMAGEFLKDTGIQYIIAMPYSENMKLFMPWVNMLINLRPKRADSLVAPPLTYGVINDEYLENRSLYKASS